MNKLIHKSDLFNQAMVRTNVGYFNIKKELISQLSHKSKNNSIPFKNTGFHFFNNGERVAD